MNFIGLFAAAAAGAAQVFLLPFSILLIILTSLQPLMTLLFGNLTQDFVNFQIVIDQANTGNPTATQELPIAAEHFRHTAAKDASYLVFIG